MLIHRPHPAGAGCGGALQFRPAIDEAIESPTKRNFAAGPVQNSGFRQELVRGGAAIRNDHGDAAGARFRRNHAESLGLASMDQSIGAREQAGELVAI